MSARNKMCSVFYLLGTNILWTVYAGLCQVDLLRGQKADRVDVTLAPEELEVMDNVLPAK